MRIFIFALAMILADILTGILKAVYKGNINSTILRKGLLHKLSEIAAIAVSYFIDYGMVYTGINLDLKIGYAVAVYIILMEIVSALENIAEVNEKLGKFLTPYLDKLKGVQNEQDRD